MCQKREIKGNKEKREKENQMEEKRKRKKNENLKGMAVEQTGEFGGIRIRKKRKKKDQ